MVVWHRLTRRRGDRLAEEPFGLHEVTPNVRRFPGLVQLHPSRAGEDDRQRDDGDQVAAARHAKRFKWANSGSTLKS
jgi:hypothetical protein